MACLQLCEKLLAPASPFALYAEEIGIAMLSLGLL
jgi:hypothetical protein